MKDWTVSQAKFCSYSQNDWVPNPLPTTTLVKYPLTKLVWFNILFLTNNSVAVANSMAIVCKGVPAPPFLRHPPLDPACPLFKIFVSPPLCSVPPPFKVF